MAKKSSKPATPQQTQSPKKSCQNQNCELFGKPVENSKLRSCPKCEQPLPNLGKPSATKKVDEGGLIEALSIADEIGLDKLIDVLAKIPDAKKLKAMLGALPTLQKIQERKKSAENA